MFFKCVGYVMPILYVSCMIYY